MLPALLRLGFRNQRLTLVESLQVNCGGGKKENRRMPANLLPDSS